MAAISQLSLLATKNVVVLVDDDVTAESDNNN